MSDLSNEGSDLDVVLSDVHINTTFTPIKAGSHALSRFYFTTPQSCSQTAHEQKLNDIKNDPETDEDGDILVRRSRGSEVERNVITIEHTLATPISSVGTQASNNL